MPLLTALMLEFVMHLHQVGPEPMLQLILGMGFIEWGLNKGKMTSLDMFEDGRAPGDFGFDPMGLMKPVRKRCTRLFGTSFSNTVGDITFLCRSFCPIFLLFSSRSRAYSSYLQGDPDQYALKEITHGRLAMLAISGMIQQGLLTDAGLFGHTA